MHVTVHAPHPDSPQLNFDPVKPKSVRKYSNNVFECDGFRNEILFPKILIVGM